MKQINKFLFVPYILWMILFIIVPVLLLIYFSFFDLQGHFSFENYKKNIFSNLL
ncbi:spermidine/putrescine ABC transporter permease [Staphylococcus gallinarum]|uniref:Spermidine/putrescine ABC transporter permease n=1 Tax=Staphylococcus gallinarum TaxID=1293 RepID=A0A380FGL7_STAGA|nr:spermidine/putrescine ABC transporter permease [Staphylococcus gallinarum]